MADAMSLGFLDFIPHAFLYLALLAWVATFAGLVRSVVRQLGREGGRAPVERDRGR